MNAFRRSSRHDQIPRSLKNSARSERLPEFHVEVPSGRSAANQAFHHDAFSHGFIILWQVILGCAKTSHFHWQRQAVAALPTQDCTISEKFGSAASLSIVGLLKDKKNPMRHTIAFIVAALLAVAPVAYGKKNIRSFSHRSSRGTKPRIRMLHSGSSKGRPHPASPHGNRVHKRL